jgi:general stress protein 26
MDKGLEATIVRLMSTTNDMTIATIRPDGYPQATTVSYVSDGMKIYFGCNAASQKARNLTANDKVSLTINAPYASWNEIHGLSLGGNAARVTDKAELARVRNLMLGKFPQIAQYGMDGEGDIAVFRISPKAISLLDYTKGFGHTDLVTL